MANELVVTRLYKDGDTFFEADLDEIKSNLETFFNETGLTGDNIQANALNGENINDNIVDGTTLEFNGDRQIQVVDDSIDSTKLAVGDPGLPIGAIEYIHLYTGTISVPRGWMHVNGNVVNEANYDAIHGAGAYDADGVANSIVDGETLPNANSGNYIMGTAGVTGSTTGSLFGDYDHNHQIVDYNGSNAQIYDANGTAGSIATVSGSSSVGHILVNQTPSFNSVDFDMYTDDLVSASYIKNPGAVYLGMIIRVV